MTLKRKYHTMKGTLTTAFSFLIGYIAPDVTPADVSHYLQDTAFLVTILVGGATLVKTCLYFKDRHSRRGKNRNDET